MAISCLKWTVSLSAPLVSPKDNGCQVRNWPQLQQEAGVSLRTKLLGRWPVHRKNLLPCKRLGRSSSRKTLVLRASGDVPPTSTSYSEDSNPADTLRQQLGDLQAEIEDIQRKANSARSRFMRLTGAVEQLRKSAEVAIRAGNESDARKQLQEKARVLEALQRAQVRAETLEALTAKLNQAICRKESQLIQTLSTLTRATSSPSTTVRVVPPSPPGTSSAASQLGEDDLSDLTESDLAKYAEGRETSGTSEPRTTNGKEPYAIGSEDELNEKFLNMERADLERMWKRTEELSREEARLSEPVPGDGKGGGGQLEPVGSLPEAELALLRGVDGEIAEVEMRLRSLEEQLSAGPAEDAAKGELRGRQKRGKEVLNELQDVRNRILARAGVSIPEPKDPSTTGAQLDAAKKGAAEGTPDTDVLLAVEEFEQGILARAGVSVPATEGPTTAGKQLKAAKNGAAQDTGNTNLLLALEEFEQGDVVAAATLLSMWLDSLGDAASDQITEVAAELAVDSSVSQALYVAFLKQHVLPSVLASASSTLEPELDHSRTPGFFQDRLSLVQQVLKFPGEDLVFVHKRIARTGALDVALSRVGNLKASVQDLRTTLRLDEQTAQEILAEAEAAAKMKRLVAVVLRNLQASALAGFGWRDANWTLKDRQRQEIEEARGSLGLEGPTALAATAAACRDVCQELVQASLGASTDKVCNLHLENIIRFVDEGAVPAMLAASGIALSASADPHPDVVNASGATSAETDASPDKLVSSSEQNPSVNQESVLAKTGGPGHVKPEKLIGLLRLSNLGKGDAEDLFRVYCKEEMAAKCREAAEAYEPGAALYTLTETHQQPSPFSRQSSILATVLNLPSEVEADLRLLSAKELEDKSWWFVKEAERASSKEWKVKQDIEFSSSAKMMLWTLDDLDSAGATLGATCRKLLNKRNNGGDITAADIRNLMFACTSSRATRVKGVDVRDRMVLFRRAVQTVLDPTNPSFKWAPSRTVLEGTQMLGVLQEGLVLPPSEVHQAVSAMTSASAAAALLQARASFRRNEIEMAADGIRRLAFVLGLHPQAVPLPTGDANHPLSPSEARALFELYSSPSAHGTRREEGSPDGLQEREMEEESLRRLRAYLGL